MHLHLRPNQSLGDFLNAWKDHLALTVSGKWFQMWRCNTLKLLSLMLNNINVKNLRCKYHLKQMTTNREKMLLQVKTTFFKLLELQTFRHNGILEQTKLANKELVIWSEQAITSGPAHLMGQPRLNYKFILGENFWLPGTKPTCFNFSPSI